MPNDKKQFINDPKSRPTSEDSLHYEAWRVLQIMSEFVMGFEKMGNISPAVTLFGSARFAESDPYYQLAEDIAYRLSDSGFSVVSGGGPGIMEAANKGAFRGHSPSVGLNITLPNEQHSNAYQDVSLHFNHFFVRKVMLVRYATAYIVLPGGFGTLDELVETLTLIQTKKIPNIPVILVGSDFWQGLLTWLKQTLIPAGTINAEDLELVQVVDTAQAVVDAIFEYYEERPPTSAAQTHNVLDDL